MNIDFSLVYTDKSNAEQEARLWRNEQLAFADIQLNKIQDGMPNLGTVAEWRKYRVALRVWPQTEGFPSEDSRPVAPNFKEE